MKDKNIIKLVELIAKQAQEKKGKITTAESCTGGMLASYLTSIAGASNYFEYGFITYSNQAKISILDVKEQTLIEYGPVSETTAKEMAIGALKKAASNIAISITGIAGPLGGSIEKPIGLVCFGIATFEVVKSFTFTFIGNRQEIRMQACHQALELILSEL